MKRRTFLQWLVGVPAVVSAAEIERRAQAFAATQPEPEDEQQKSLRLYGSDHIQRVPDVVNDHADRIDELEAVVARLRREQIL